MAVQVLVLKERADGERRVAATPETVKKLVARGASVWIEPDAGRASSMDDAVYLQAGAQPAGADAWHGPMCCSACRRHSPQRCCSANRTRW